MTFNNVELHNDNSQEQLRALAKLVVVSALWHGMDLLDRKNTALKSGPVAKSDDHLSNQTVTEPVKVNIPERAKEAIPTGDRPVKIEDNLVNQSVPIQEPVKLNISDIVPS
ncbi:MAG: hypothetical protein ACRC2J_05460 [Microcoleaceae cyanobacterium]